MPSADPRTQADTLNVRNHLAVRDVLRRRDDFREAYAAVKRELAADPSMDIGTYIARKSDVRQRVLAESDLTDEQRLQIWRLNNPEGVAVLPESVPVLEHGGVRLRPWRDDDAGVVASVASDPLIPLITTVPARPTAENVSAFLERQRRRLDDGEGYSFAIADIATDEAVGNIGLWTSMIESGRATTGYWIAPQFRRRGYVSSALQALTTWAMTLPEVERLELYVEPWNQGSWRAAEAAGYVREGLLRAWQRVGDARKDMYMYSVLSSH
jgi:[ribosomal protein S5]-alanine N-acetyltransferase